ncbi:hypothetical protein F5Y08DRAFT_119050 [Xylaria arbuscula]|nr:hypothetical protein F5Y08DRAFT_119050 [Xylaria arbuscula]
MNRNQATGVSNTGRILRQRPLLLAGIMTTGLAVAAVSYRRMILTRNERAQRNGQEPNYYVTVDRSGGGI